MESKIAEIRYELNKPVDVEDVIQTYISSGINRPTADKERIAEMYANSNLVISAWHNEVLVGVSRALTDFCYCCYLADLAVKESYQKQGIGKKLIELTREAIGDKTMLLLLSAAGAMEYYPKINFDKVENGFFIPRKW